MRHYIISIAKLLRGLAYTCGYVSPHPFALGRSLTPTDFEHGQFVAKLNSLEHKLKSMSAAMTLLAKEQDEMSANLQRIRVEIRTTLSVLGAIGSAVAYFYR